MADKEPVVFIVDDDSAVREALDSLIRSVGFSVQTFASADDFLRSRLTSAQGCLVLDVRLPGLSGLDLQSELARADVHMPIIFISGHSDIPMTVRAMKAANRVSRPNPSAIRICWTLSGRLSSAIALPDASGPN